MLIHFYGGSYARKPAPRPMPAPAPKPAPAPAPKASATAVVTARYEQRTGGSPAPKAAPKPAPAPAPKASATAVATARYEQTSAHGDTVQISSAAKQAQQSTTNSKPVGFMQANTGYTPQQVNGTGPTSKSAMVAWGVGVAAIATAGAFGIAASAGGAAEGATGASTLTTAQKAAQIAQNLPKNPQQLLDRGWTDVTHPDQAIKTSSTQLRDPESGITVRFDPGTPGEPGWKGIDHYHIENPDSTGKGDYYFDKSGNTVPKNSIKSHIEPTQ